MRKFMPILTSCLKGLGRRAARGGRPMASLMALAAGWALAGQALAQSGAVAPESGPVPATPFGLPPLIYTGWFFESALLAALLALAIWRAALTRQINRPPTPGFEVVTGSEKRSFIPLIDKYQSLEFANAIKTQGDLRISGNLNKVNLSIRRYGYLLEDKNFRNALLVNRRRVRRTLLRDGDVLDLGDLTLLYRDTRYEEDLANQPGREGRMNVRFDRLRGPVRLGSPMLMSDQLQGKIFFITKNMVYIGRSEMNDMVLKSPNVAFRQAKIERVGAKYNLLDLSGNGSTFVNNRRVEQKFLKEGDEISLDNYRFKFQFATKAQLEKPSGAPRRGRDRDSFQGRSNNRGGEQPLDDGANPMGDGSSDEMAPLA